MNWCRRGDVWQIRKLDRMATRGRRIMTVITMKLQTEKVRERMDEKEEDTE